jgi:dTDP-4-amino-4,6-dideoxygalactose transaminase
VLQEPAAAVRDIPFHRPHLTGDEADCVASALASGHLHGDGPFTAEVSQRLSELSGSGRVMLTPSCTHALELAALLLDLDPGDEVVMPSFTFVSTANAFALRGARPVFVDVDPLTLDLDPAAVADAVTERTRAIVVVHYAGIACDMDALLAIADTHGIPLIEDNAHGLCGTYRDRPLGSLGAMSALSFHDTKNIQCGEGGALVVNRPDLVGRAEVLREKGTNRQAFMRHEVEKYTWVDVGSSYLLGEVLAAVLKAQLDHVEEIQKARHEIWATYHSELRTWSGAVGAQLPHPDPVSQHPAHLYHLLLPTADARTRFLDHVRAARVGAAFHYVPLHDTPIARRLGHEGPLPVTESAAERLARIPLYPDLRADEVDRILEVVTSFGG